MNDSDPVLEEPIRPESGQEGAENVDEHSPTELVSSFEPRPLPGDSGIDRTKGVIDVAAFEELGDRAIGDFQLIRRLGVGGMAEVYLAEQKSLRRKVALKILRSEILSGRKDVLLDRFDREARAAAALTHQNIVQVHGVGEENGLHWIAQEYVHGINLKQYLGRKGPPDAALALKLAKQIALALRAAAEAGIVHRDVKPENVLVTSKGRVKVADFGLARLTRDEKTDLTQVGMTMGTPLYMSPEQVNGKPTDARSDLYSFGVTLYHLLAGEPPFRGETALAIAVKHLNEQPQRLHERRADLPRSLCDLVHRMMEKDPARRPADAGVVYDELKRIADAVKVAENGGEIDPLDRPVASGANWTGPVDRRNLVRHAVAFLVCALVVGSVSAAVGWWTRPANPLNEPPAAATIARKDNVDEQVWFALRVRTEEAWQAVVDYFDDDPAARRAVARARIRLGVFAMSDRRFDEARRRFDEVYTEHESDPGLRANAIAGLAATDSLAGDYAASQRLIVEEAKLLSDELDGDMKRIVESTIRRNRDYLGAEVDEDLEELFRSEPEFE